MKIATFAKAAFSLTLFFCAGCASLAEKGLLPEISSRVPPNMRQSSTFVLLEEPIWKIKGIARQNGNLDLFALDKQDQLIHIVLQNDQIIFKSVVGKIQGNEKIFLDAVETPDKGLRVLAGDHQFVFNEDSETTREIKNNRCEHFITANQRLFCTFIIPGKDIGSLKRTDVTAGIFFILPIVLWHDKQASKLVLAEETPQGWLIRSIIEPESIMNVSSDYLAGVDNQGNIQLSYHLYRGGGFFMVGGVYGAGAMLEGSGTDWRYAKISAAELNNEIPNKQSGNFNIKHWMPVQGTNIEIGAASFVDKPFGAKVAQTRYVDYLLRPLNRRFALDPLNGDLDGILWVTMHMDEGKKTLSFEGGGDKLWFEVSGLNHVETSHFDILAADDLPISGIKWSYSPSDALFIDKNGLHHALIHSINSNDWNILDDIHYIRKTNGQWSAPVMLGVSKRKDVSSHELVGTDNGDVLVIWTNEDDKVVGRWLHRNQG